MKTIEEKVIDDLQVINQEESAMIRVNSNHAKVTHINPQQGVINLNGMRINIFYSWYIIHNIISRINHTNSIKESLIKWNNSSEATLIKNMEELFNSGDIFLHLIPKRNGDFMLYGMSTNRFVPVNSIHFRDTFLSEIKTSSYIQEVSIKTGRTKQGEVFEVFNFVNNRKEEINLSIVLIYGLNNGYSSYRIMWERKVIKCENQLSPTASQVQWRHSNRIDLNSFLKSTVTDTFTYYQQMKIQMDAARTRLLDVNAYTELFNRLHTSDILKERIKERFHEELQIEGNNEFALSQAFTNVGTHFYGNKHDLYHKGLCIKTGSQIFDSTLQNFLDEPVHTIPYQQWNTYGELLPRTY